ncbi:N-acetyltransferase family protein [Flavobacteriaceae bacterium S0825]|uniref:GNAT family N-acetyltransferase n=1 Tax=Gaetbulibacter sp. S0825 TaxID=2720084 RepID=UPI00142FD016|nr:GNAT family N-acetyltransferase [Gaetbulibacter sp. S0825]MCK0107735.1 N-acetyltransferase family protein [Flavobacteriaceae bacterium S0825]NIX63371.1 N-acetyltransferase [Gaetbulibacter sp. S0825]
MKLEIRAFNKQDWASVSKIYAEGIATGVATFETEAPSFNVWDNKFIKQCRLVAEVNSKVVGFAVLSQVSKREVYKGVAEVTVYVAANERGKGIGKRLLETLVIESEKKGFWTLQAGIFSANKASIELHKKCGFRVVGIREKIGKRDGKWHDNHFLERRSNKVGYK